MLGALDGQYGLFVAKANVLTMQTARFLLALKYFKVFEICDYIFEYSRILIKSNL